MSFAGFLLAIAIGLLLGLLGGGGSILAVPVFVYVLGIPTKLAIAASLGVVGAASLAGAIPQYRAGNVDLRTAFWFALGSAAGALAGAGLGGLVDGSVQLLTFGAVMLVAAASMLRRGPAIAAVSARRGTARGIALTLVLGIGVGVLTGFVGVGGGFLIVPALVLLAGLPMKRAVGTSLAVIAANSAAGFAGYLLQPAIRQQMAATTVGAYPLPLYLALFTVLAIAGGFLGARLGYWLRPETLRRAFAVALILMAVFMLARNV